MTPDQIRSACMLWGYGPATVCEPLGASGFSGVPLFAVQFADIPGRRVLKAFSADSPRERCEWVHALMRHARAAGVTEVPEILPAASGDTVVTAADGSRYELIRFVAGSPCESPSSTGAAAAIEVVGRLHHALASLPGTPPARAPSPGAVRRIEQARELLRRPWAERLNERGGPKLSEQLLTVFEAAARTLASPIGTRAVQAVAGAEPAVVPCQAVVRDLWSDHVLFEPEEPARVAGIVDFHAAGIDTPLTDLARLLGSWRRTGSDSLVERWQAPLASYERVRPLTADERWLIDWLHASAVICGLDNWFRWLVEESRQFSGANRVAGRVMRLLDDLPAAASWLAAAGARGTGSRV